MGKATITGNLGQGRYEIATVFDTAVAASALAKLEAVLAKVQARIAEIPEIEELRVLMIRERALEAEIAKIEAAANVSRTRTVWCADLTDDLTGTVGTVEVEADADQGGLMVQPGYAGKAAYDAARDGIEVPFRTMPVADAVLNFSLMPAIQKFKPTYRYGTVSLVDPQAGTCNLALEDSNSVMQAININRYTYFTGVPVEYMSCNATPFEYGDKVLARYYPYDATGTIKVIGFKDNPKPCESRHILIETTFAWLLYDIVGRRTAYNLGEGAPTFPCLKDATTNAWIAAHVTDDANDTLYATISDTVDWDYVKPVRDFGPIFNDPWYFYIDNDLILDCLRNGDEWQCDAGGWGSSSAGAVCLESCEEATFEMNPYIAAFPAHTGETIEEFFGANPNWGFWHPVCCRWIVPDTQPEYHVVYSNSYREWDLIGCLSGYNKIIHSNGPEGDRSFILRVEGWGETYNLVGFPFYISQEHYIETTFSFYGPFQSEVLTTKIDLWEYPIYDEIYGGSGGIQVTYFSNFVQTKHNGQDMVGVCTFSWKIHQKNGGVDQVGAESPHVDWYISKDIDSQNIPNPWGSHLQRDENLSTIFANMINTLNTGTLDGFNFRFVDVTTT